jgi:hypothetical protein
VSAGDDAPATEGRVSPVAEIYFLAMTLGVPLVMLALAMLAAHFHGDGCAELLDWQPTRSPQREAELELSDIDQMLAAQNRHRRARGAPERSLAELTEQVRANVELYEG